MTVHENPEPVMLKLSPLAELKANTLMPAMKGVVQ
jgi:hypothetical protein